MTMSMMFAIVTIAVPRGDRPYNLNLALDELREFAAKATGEPVEVVKEDEVGDRRAIYLGPTKFAADRGIDCAKLGWEDWIVRDCDGNLVLTGGNCIGAVGSRFAVYHFLEDVVGIHWLAPTEDGTYIPAAKPLDWHGVDLRGCPKLRYRHCYNVPGALGDRFLSRNRATTYRNVYGASAHGGSHTMYTTLGDRQEIARLFREHPEWFPLIDGKRFCDVAKGGSSAQSQLCLTNEELTRYWASKLRAEILADRIACRRNLKQPPYCYAIDQNDCYDGFCKCDRCMEIVNREGGNAGLLLDFVNRIADMLGDEFPEVTFQMMALHSTEQPPKTMKARPNVSVRLCDTTSNVLVDWKDPQNRKHYDNLVEWTNHVDRIGMWDYSINYGSTICVNYPTPTERTFAADLRTLLANRGDGVFFEHEQYVGADMRDLKVWVEFKLAEDPDLDGDDLIRTFTDLYYGEAAGAVIREYRLMLEEKGRAAKAHVSWFPSLSSYSFIDWDAVVKGYEAYGRALAAVKGDEAKTRRVEHAFLSLDRIYAIRAGVFRKAAELNGIAAEKLPEVKTVLARYARVYDYETKHRGYDEKTAARKRNLEDFLKMVEARRDLPVPAIFADVPQGALFLYACTLANRYHNSVEIVDDPSSPAGKAARIAVGPARRMPKPYPKSYFWPMPWALWPTMKGTVRGLLQSGPIELKPGYHWYKCAENALLQQDSSFSIGGGWFMPLDGAVSDNSELGQAYDIWVSLKIEGVDRLAEGELPDETVLFIDQFAVIRKTLNAAR